MDLCTFDFPVPQAHCFLLDIVFETVWIFDDILWNVFAKLYFFVLVRNQINPRFAQLRILLQIRILVMGIILLFRHLVIFMLHILILFFLKSKAKLFGIRQIFIPNFRVFSLKQIFYSRHQLAPPLFHAALFYIHLAHFYIH